MSRTDTDVIVTEYRAVFDGVAPFASYSAWRISGGMEYRHRLSRRRRDTVAREYATTGGRTELARKRSTDDGRMTVGHIHASMLVDTDAVVVFIPDTPSARFGTAVVVEQVAR